MTERELAHERLLLLDEGHCLRDQALAVCGDQYRGREGANDDFRATSLETISEMVAAGIGCTLLPAMAVPHLTARHQRLEVRPLRRRGRTAVSACYGAPVFRAARIWKCSAGSSRTSCRTASHRSTRLPAARLPAAQA